MMKTRMLLIGLVILGWSACMQAGTITYDAAADFSAVNNPNGAWSYGYCANNVGPSGFTAFPNHRTWSGREAAYAGIDAWDRGDTLPNAYDPSVTHNGSGGPITAYGYTWAVGDLGLDSHGSLSAIVRWTAPGEGFVDVSATFTNMGPESTSVYVFKNFIAVVATTSTSAGVSGAYSDISVAKGDVIDFAASGFVGSVTKLDATIVFTAVPEPSSIIMSGISIIGLLAYAWRKRK